MARRPVRQDRPKSNTVRLAVGGQSFTQPLEVRRDPNVPATDLEIKAAADVQLSMQADMNTSTEMLNTIESARAQLQALATPSNPAEVRAGGDSLEKKFIIVEENLVDLRLTGRGQDGVRFPVKAVGQLSYLAGQIGGSDLTPTAQQRAVRTVLGDRVRSTHQALDRLIQTDLSRFNALLRSKNMKTIDVKTPVVF